MTIKIAGDSSEFKELTGDISGSESPGVVSAGKHPSVDCSCDVNSLSELSRNLWVLASRFASNLMLCSNFAFTWNRSERMPAGVLAMSRIHSHGCLDKEGSEDHVSPVHF